MNILEIRLTKRQTRRQTRNPIKAYRWYDVLYKTVCQSLEIGRPKNLNQIMACF